MRRPALDREYFGFLNWHGHDAELWARLRAEALARRSARVARRCILGSDIDSEAVRMAIANAEQAGVADWLHVEKRALSEVPRPEGDTGLIVANLPYGTVIGAESGRSELYSELGRVLRDRFQGWQAAILIAGNPPPLARNLGIYAKRTAPYSTARSSAGCCASIPDAASAQRPAEEVRADWSSRPGARMFANRLRKNLQRLIHGRSASILIAFSGVRRGYAPEYAFAIDLYGRESRHVYAQEYAAPKSVNQRAARTPP